MHYSYFCQESQHIVLLSLTIWLGVVLNMSFCQFSCCHLLRVMKLLYSEDTTMLPSLLLCFSSTEAFCLQYVCPCRISLQTHIYRIPSCVSPAIITTYSEELLIYWFFLLGYDSLIIFHFFFLYGSAQC